ncbi:diguanylate cyclase (GGDEF)-like protein/PAS domain S-box-containing protein [Bacillus ectoiniformans]|uniref:EAL domain-containing protein n=1 Tax=Bacillus ectoiniformans TaxID=1494429 RepID=UPI0019599C66|nr:EAL domain-containing protein [Bacillus ectoiniformans]MBM7648669.1 diguanylate cyclase (GGDEF)-like protein/PAS domain S-box-containing protein [Bacillus ectoiniformans]
MIVKKMKENYKRYQASISKLTSTESVYKADQQKMLQSIFENHPDGIYTIDLKGNILDCNARILTMFGMTQKKAQTHFKHYLLASELPAVQQHFTRALRGETVQYTTVGLHQDGHTIDIHITNIPLVIEGQIIGVYGICKDVTELTRASRELDRVKDNLSMSQKIAHIGSWQHDIPNKEALLSKQACEILDIDYSRTAKSLDQVIQYIEHQDGNKLVSLIQQATPEKNRFYLEAAIISGKGEKKSSLIEGMVKFSSNGKPLQVNGVIREVTKLRELETRLSQLTSRSKQILDSLDVAVWSLDPIENQVVFCSEGVEKIYGLPKEQFINQPSVWFDMIHPDDQQTVLSKQSALYNGEKLQHEYRIITPLFQTKWVSDNSIPILDEEGRLIRIDGLVTDITDQKDYEHQMQFMTNHDFLTRLPNRYAFEQDLLTQTDQVPMYILYVDLDRFAQVNDSLGHSVGDGVIKETAARLQKLIPSEALLARIGGDEFAIAIKSTMDDPEDVAKTIIKQMKRPFFIEEFEIMLTVSIGISTYPADGQDPHQLLKNAYTAMLRVKEVGRSTYRFYTSSMNVESYKLFQLEKDLRHASALNQLFLEYQPKVDAKTGRITGAEALIRWNHPTWGRVSPNEFIPLAEENGLILEIGDWVIESVCANLRTWIDEGRKVVPISLNISPKRFLNPSFKDEVKTAINKHQIPPELIEIEITESAILHQESIVREIIQDLREFGLKFSLDDVGTGYSSISYLMKYDLDAIKIDRDLVRDMCTDPKRQALIKSMVYLAKELDIDIVLEGVERLEQLQFFQQIEVPSIQGFLFSKPVLSNKFVVLLEKGRLKPIPPATKNGFVNRRKYFRAHFHHPLKGMMSLKELKGKKVQVGSSPILIKNVGVGGLCFISNINLPVHPELILEMNFSLNGRDQAFLGKIKWKEDSGDDLYEYGLEFAINEDQRSDLIPLLNKLTLQLKRDPFPNGYDWHLEGPRVFFQKNK